MSTKVLDFLKKVCAVAAAVLIILPTMQVNAASHTIYNNGYAGITINIDAGYYQQLTSVPTYGKFAYTTSGCAWFASARVRELTGKGSTIWNGIGWWNNYASCGFTRGTTLDRSKRAIVCWGGHVAIIEGYTSDGKIIVSEGGVSHLDYVTAANGYCQITTFSSEASLKRESSSQFYGYVYLNDITPQAVDVKFNDFNTSAAPNANLGIWQYDATIGRTINISGADISAIEEVGIVLYDGDTMAVVGSKAETPRSKDGAINVWYNMKSEVTNGANLIPGHNYIGVFHAKLNSSYGGTVFNYNYPFKTIGINVTGITVSPSSGTVLVGGSISLNKSISPSDASNKNVTWSSSNINIAAVDNNGNVTGIAPGSATITCAATDGSGKYGSCTITVNKLVSEIRLNKNAMELRAGDSETLEATVLDEDASFRSVIWYSEDSNVASVDSNGKVTAVGAGTTTIVASSSDGSGVSATCIVTVNPAVDVFELEKHSITMYSDGGIGNRYELKYRIEPADEAGSIVWSSSNSDIVEVSDTGIVTAKDEGRAIVTAYIPGGLSDQCIINVSANSDVLIMPADLTDIGEEAFMGTKAQRVHIQTNCTQIGSRAFARSSSLRYVFIPASVITIAGDAFEGSNNVCIICSRGSDAESYAADNGIDYILDDAAAYIAVRSITIPSTLTINVEESVPLNAVILPENASNKSVIYSSSNPDIAIVSADGIVTGVSDGTAVITAEPNGGYRTATCSVTVKMPNVKISAETNTDIQEIGSKNAILSANLSISGAEAERVKLAGIVLYDQDKTMLMSEVNEPDISGNQIVVNVDLKNDCNYPVSPVTKYYYRYAVNVSGIMFYSNYFSFTTEEAPPEIVLSSENLTISDSEEATITAQVLYSDDQDIIWRSSNSAVAYVVDGTIIVNGEGTTVITAMLANDTSVKATCTVTVVGSGEGPLEISLNESSIELNTGESFELKAATQPPSDFLFGWESSDTNVATVLGGVVYAARPGTAVITATLLDGSNQTATCTVTVKETVPDPVIPDPINPGIDVNDLSCGCSTQYAGDYVVTGTDGSLAISSGHGPSYNYTELGVIPEGTVVHIIAASGPAGTSKKWGHVTYNNISGYCSMYYLSPYTGSIDTSNGNINSTKLNRVIARANAWADYTWTAPVDIPVYNNGYGSNNTQYWYKAGTVMHGIPYTLNYSKYNLDTYGALTDAKKGSASVFSYTDPGTNETVKMWGTTYGCDCSGLVNDCLWYGDSTIGHDGQTNLETAKKHLYDHVSWDNIAPGDVLGKAGHVILVIAVNGDQLTVVESRGNGTNQGALYCANKEVKGTDENNNISYYVCGKCERCNGAQKCGPVRHVVSKSSVMKNYSVYRYKMLYTE